MLLNEEKIKMSDMLRVNLPVYLKSGMFLEERYFRVTERRYQKDSPAFSFTHFFSAEFSKRSCRSA